MLDYLVAEALERRKIFQNLNVYLEKLKEMVLRVDPHAEIYLFGSVAENRYNYSSDIDILVVCEADRRKLLKVLAEEDFMKVFQRPKETNWYKRMTRLVRI